MLTPEAAAELPGPQWLRTLRSAAAERLVTEPLPTPKLEEWRYSPVDSVDLDAYAVSDSGLSVSLEVADEVLAAGVSVGSVLDRDEAVAFGEGPDVFSLANLAFAADPVLVEVPNGVQVSQPIVVTNEVTADGALVLPRLRVVVGGGGSVEVLVVTRSADIAALVLSVVEVDAAPGARAVVTTVQDLGPRVTQIDNHSATVAAQATVDESLVAVGGGYTRQRNDCRLEGRGASAQLTALYYGDDEQVLDFRTFYDHIAPDTTSNLLFKGALDDAAKSVYTGLIRVHPDARGTNAMQTNRNLKLSEEAWAESVPNLEIENNDVRCAHASTMGPIDVDHRFYLESRGVPPATAERLIVAGFFDEAVERLGVHPAQLKAHALLDAKIEAGS